MDSTPLLKKYIDMKNGNLFPLISDKFAFNFAITELSKIFNNLPVSKVVSIEATGFIFGGAVAHKLEIGFVPIRKAGKLKGEIISSSDFVDSSKISKKLELQISMLNKGDKVLFVDDWVQSAAQLITAIKLIESLDVEISGIGVVLDESNQETRDLLSKYNYHYLIDYSKCWD